MKRLVSIAIIVVLLALCACSPAKRIVGEWKTQSTVLGVVVETTYVFDEINTFMVFLSISVKFHNEN